MRLSTRLLSNALTTYGALAANFVVGVFFTWFVVGQVGLAGLGIISITAGSFGISYAIDRAIAHSLNRELAASLATGDPERIQRTFVSALVLTVCASLVVLLCSGVLIVLTLTGVFPRLLEDMPGLRLATAALFASEAVHTSLRVALSPFRQSLYASQRIGLENLLMTLGRVMRVTGVVLALAVFWPGAAMHERLTGFALVNALAMSVDIVVAVLLARKCVPALRIRIAAFDRSEVRSIWTTLWHTSQMMFLMDFLVYFVAVLLNLFFGVTYNGVWSIVILVGGYATLVSEGVLRGIDPIATHLGERGLHASVNQLMVHTIRYQLTAALGWTVGFVVFMKPILWLWVGNRLRTDPNLAEAGITVTQAVDLIALMSTIYLVAVVSRVAVRGVERMLFGLGYVRDYAWFAKYATAMTVLLAGLWFWLVDDPVGAPVPILLAHLAYYQVLIPRVAVRRVSFPVRSAFLRSVPRPVAAVAVLLVPLLLLRAAFPTLGLLTLCLVAAVSGAIYAPLVYFIVLSGEERSRLGELVATVRRRGLRRPGLDDHQAPDGSSP